MRVVARGTNRFIGWRERESEYLAAAPLFRLRRRHSQSAAAAGAVWRSWQAAIGVRRRGIDVERATDSLSLQRPSLSLSSPTAPAPAASLAFSPDPPVGSLTATSDSCSRCLLPAHQLPPLPRHPHLQQPPSTTRHPPWPVSCPQQPHPPSPDEMLSSCCCCCCSQVPGGDQAVLRHPSGSREAGAQDPVPRKGPLDCHHALHLPGLLSGRSERLRGE